MSMYFSGFVEALLSNLGEGGTLIQQYSNSTNGIFPGEYWAKLGYGSVILLFCLIVCLIGAGAGHMIILYTQLIIYNNYIN